MKQILIAFAFLVFSSVSYGQTQVEMCVARSDGTLRVNGEVVERGKLVASITHARLRAQGQTCEGWLASLKQSHFGGCQLRADGKVLVDNGTVPPARGTVIAEGRPNPGQSCDDWRRQKADEVVTGTVE